MHSRIFIFVSVLLLSSCKYDNFDGPDGFEIKKVTYTIEDEAPTRKTMTQKFVSPNVTNTYFAKVVKKYDPSNGSNSVNYVIYLEDNVYHNGSRLNITAFGDTLKYINYKLIPYSTPAQTNEAYVTFEGGSYDNYSVNTQKTCYMTFSKVNNEFDKLTIGFFGMVYSGQSECEFNGEFYLKR